jgi:D-alanine--poly(phosphoribitol) ligase subunit 2
MSTHLVSLIVETLRELNGQQQMKKAVNLDSDTPLFGPDGVLDSMGMIMLLVSLEQVIEDTHGVSINLADEKALSQQNSLYRTIGSLADYASRLLQADAATR